VAAAEKSRGRCKNPTGTTIAAARGEGENGVPRQSGALCPPGEQCPPLLGRLAHFRANWAALLDFSNCIFGRRRRRGGGGGGGGGGGWCRREDKNCLSIGRVLHRVPTPPFPPLPLLPRPSSAVSPFSFASWPFGSFFVRGMYTDGCGSPPAAVADKAAAFPKREMRTRDAASDRRPVALHVFCGGKSRGRDCKVD